MKLAVVLALALPLSCACLSDQSAEQLRQEYAKAAKDSAPFLPPPFNYLVAITGTLAAGWGGHKTIRHVKKKRAAKAAPTP